MPFGTAAARLRKLILFSLVKRLNIDDCYRCSKPIDSAGELSIEHKDAWMDNSAELFWDLENIAFSHLICNVQAARKTTKRENPPGKKWCWKHKEFLDLDLFPPNANQNRYCTFHDSEYRKEYRKNSKRR